MKRVISYSTILGIFLFLIFSVSGCKNEDSIVQPTGSTDLHQAFEKIADNDQAVQSFEANYNEEQAISLADSQLGKGLYPLKVGQRMELVDRQLSIDYGDSTAIGTLTSTYNGELIIVASFTPPTDGIRPPDTTVTKNFSTVITRKIQFVKVDNTGDNLVDWQISAISLPEGGTQTSGVTITKLTLFAPDGSTLVIDSPNDYFLERGPGNNNGNGPDNENVGNGNRQGSPNGIGAQGPGNGMGDNQQGPQNGNGPQGSGNRMGNDQGGQQGQGTNGNRPMLPSFGMNQPVTIQVELESAYTDTDLVTITHGAMLGGIGREKERFHLISETPSGGTFTRIFEVKWFTNMHAGFRHAVVNAIPYQTIFDSDAQVEENTWGVPYKVQ